MRQLVTDRALLRRMKQTAVEAKDYVAIFFCESLLAVVKNLLPDDSDPSGPDLDATIMIEAPGDEDPPDVAQSEALIASMPGLVARLKV